MAAVAALLSLCFSAPACDTVVVTVGMQCDSGYSLISPDDATSCTPTLCSLLDRNNLKWGQIHIDSTDKLFVGSGYKSGCGVIGWNGVTGLGQSLCAPTPAPVTPPPPPPVDCYSVVVTEGMQCDSGYRLISPDDATRCRTYLCSLLTLKGLTWGQVHIDSTDKLFVGTSYRAGCGVIGWNGVTGLGQSLCAP